MGFVQRLSPGFPVGGYAYSHGLEWAMADGRIAGAAGLSDWIADLIRTGSGRGDAILLCRSMDAGADHAALAAFARALAPAPERWRESAEQGRAFGAVNDALAVREAGAALPYPVAVGCAAAELGLAPALAAALWLQAFAANLVQAAVRFLPLGQTEGQRILAGLHPLILAVAAEAAEAPLTAIGGAAVLSDLAAMRHEVMEVRIFRT